MKTHRALSAIAIQALLVVGAFILAFWQGRWPFLALPYIYLAYKCIPKMHGVDVYSLCILAYWVGFAAMLFSFHAGWAILLGANSSILLYWFEPDIRPGPVPEDEGQPGQDKKTGDRMNASEPPC